MMHITFNAIGLNFDAEISYISATPGRYSGPPEDCYPDEPAELEFISLVTYSGKDAMFLLESNCAEDIEQAAYEAAEEYLEDQEAEAMERFAESRAEF